MIVSGNAQVADIEGGIAEEASIPPAPPTSDEPLTSDEPPTSDEPTTPPPPLKVFDENAFAKLKSYLDGIGLGGLTGKVQDLIGRGITDESAVMFELRETDVFKKRFVANIARKAKNLPELSPSTYVALEEKYRDTLRANGLDASLYDAEDDFRQFLEGDVSPAELQNRIESGYRAVKDADPEVIRQMKELYNVQEGQLAQYFLDPGKTTPQLIRRAQAAEIAARAKEQGKIQLSPISAEELVSRGYTKEQAAEAFGILSEQAGLFTAMAGESELTQEEKIGSLFGYDPKAKKKILDRVTARKNVFQGGGDFARTTGATSNTVQTGLGVAE